MAWNWTSSGATGPSTAATSGSTAGSSPASRRPASTAGRPARRITPKRAERPVPARPPRPRSAPASGPACAAGRTPRRARRSGTCRADVVGRAMRLIARRRRGPRRRARARRAGSATPSGTCTGCCTAELGAGPLALARAQRAQTARMLIETTELGLAEIAFAAGFGSVRQFNDTIREVYGGAAVGAARRAAAAGGDAGEPGTIALRLAYRAPLHAGALLEFLAARAIARRRGGRATARTAAGCACRTAPATVGADAAARRTSRATLRLADVRDLAPAVARCRRLLDLDADPVAVDATLAADPALAAAVAKEPGVRVPARGRRLRDGGAGRRRPADLGRRPPARCWPASSPAWSPGRAADGVSGPDRRRTRGSTLPDEAFGDADRAGGTTHPRRSAAAVVDGRLRPRPRRRPGGDRGGALLALPGIGAVDRRLRRAARARRPGRLPPHRPRRTPGRRRRSACPTTRPTLAAHADRLAALALLRHDPTLEERMMHRHDHATPRPARSRSLVEPRRRRARRRLHRRTPTSCWPCVHPDLRGDRAAVRATSAR